MDASPIVVDRREPQEVLAHFVTEGIEVESDTLYAGDIFWTTEEASYGIELKSVSDFLGSLWSKETGERLEWQLERLRKSVDVPVLGLHGLRLGQGATLDIIGEPRFWKGYYHARVFNRTGYRKSSVTGFLFSIQNPTEGNPVRLIECGTKADLLAAISGIYRWSRENSHGTFNHTTRRAPSKDNSNADLLNLLSIPGVGEERAKALLDRFGTPLRVYLAEDKELLEVPGVGKDTVRKIREVVGHAPTD